MGDRYDRRGRGRHAPRPLHVGKLPPTLLAWGLGLPAGVGHNNGPPIEDEQPGYLWRRYRWKKAHAAAWKTPSQSVAKFRLARAEAAGLSYRDYTAQLLDTGRFAQARDRDPVRLAALAALRQSWATAVADVAPQASRMASAIVLGCVTAAYDEPARAYHGVAHVAAVLADLARYGQRAQDRSSLMMAALFHDIVYDPRRDDNETESARVVGVHLADLGVDAQRIHLIQRMIEATRHRLVDVAHATGDTALLLDCDLAILAAPKADYRAYAAAVRREYAHVADDAWCKGRLRVLKQFVDRDRLYVTPALAQRWDAQARANLNDEIAALQGVEMRPLQEQQAN